MRVYHGSDTYIHEIDLQKCKPAKDFGRGFYVTKIKSHAEDMAKRVARWSKKQITVTEFEFDEYAWEDAELNVLRFDGYDEKWLDFVVANRARKQSNNFHDYDIVEGPVADDRIARRVTKYIKGDISKNDFLSDLTHNESTHQVCFCTLRSLQMLELTDDVTNQIVEDISEAIVGALVANEGISTIEACDKYYSSVIYKNLEDTTTDLYLKPWQEIYDLLNQELNTN
ncbi:MAG: DUF3990 domain-containing protein [Bacteroidales bacterium]|nr:DUF3990 domain-containing protein [Bacteroidales bacterium]